MRKVCRRAGVIMLILYMLLFTACSKPVEPIADIECNYKSNVVHFVFTNRAESDLVLNSEQVEILLNRVDIRTKINCENREVIAHSESANCVIKGAHLKQGSDPVTYNPRANILQIKTSARLDSMRFRCE